MWNPQRINNSFKKILSLSYLNEKLKQYVFWCKIKRKQRNCMISLYLPKHTLQKNANQFFIELTVIAAITYKTINPLFLEFEEQFLFCFFYWIHIHDLLEQLFSLSINLYSKTNSFFVQSIFHNKYVYKLNKNKFYYRMVLL